MLEFMLFAPLVTPGLAFSGDIASTIIQLERAALDRSDKGDPGGFLEISDPDVTYFDPFLDKPIRGLEALREYYQRVFGSETGSGDMVDPRVQTAGDVAVLTFNYVSKATGSGRVTLWSTTEVYRLTPKGWRIMHTHWSLAKPRPAQE